MTCILRYDCQDECAEYTPELPISEQFDTNSVLYHLS